MTIKILGLFAVVISCFLIGISIYEKYYRRTVFLQNYINFIIHIKNEINYTQNPIHKIFENSRSQIYLKNYVLKLLENLKTDSLEHSWEHTFKDVSKTYGISQSEENTIIELGKNLGIGDPDTQINILDHHIEVLKTYLDEATKTRNSKGKLPIILGLGIGLFIAIIFL